MNTKIKVVVRGRPFNQLQSKRGARNSMIKFLTDSVQVTESQRSKKYIFDQVLDPAISQAQLYNLCNISKMVQNLIEGFNASILVYGQTSSGKTFTMDGFDYAQSVVKAPADPNQAGIIPRVFQELFKSVGKFPDSQFSIRASFLQIYNESIYDLLNPLKQAQGLKLRWTKSEQFVVQNLYEIQCKSYQQIYQLFKRGLCNRITSSHKLNQSSSRSHSILTIKVQNFSNSTISKLQLVDLAGSERIGQTGSEGKQAKEGIQINKSLFTLRIVINTLADRTKSNLQEFVPYRDSKLTSILKQSIGGNCYCLMLACLNPNDQFLSQNVSTLNYASKASHIYNHPVCNKDPRDLLIQKLSQQVQGLKRQLHQASLHIQMFQEQRFNEPRVQRSAGQIPAPAKYQNFSEHLVQTIKMVSQLLKSNAGLQQQLDYEKDILQQNQSEIHHLKRQNQRLRKPPPYRQSTGFYKRDAKSEHRPWRTGQAFRPSTRQPALRLKLNETSTQSFHTNFYRPQSRSLGGERLIQGRNLITSVGGKQRESVYY